MNIIRKCCMYWYFDSYLCIRKKGKRHAYIICFCLIWFLPFHFCSLFIFYFVFNRRKKSWMCFLFVVCFPISVYIHSPMFASILFFSVYFLVHREYIVVATIFFFHLDSCTHFFCSPCWIFPESVSYFFVLASFVLLVREPSWT